MELIVLKDRGVDLVISPNELPTSNRALAVMSVDERNEILQYVKEETDRLYPTMCSSEGGKTYLMTKTAEEIAYDFSISHEGNEIEKYVVKAGGMSPEYKKNVEINAEVNHWRGFWIQVNEAQERNERYPDFYFHVPYIHWYAFHVLPLEETLYYLKFLRTKLLAQEQSYPDLMVKNVDAKLKNIIDRLAEAL